MGVRVTPACGMDRGDECCVLLSSRSDNHVAQVMPPHVRKALMISQNQARRAD
jgi:hypothetical protein